MSFDDDYAGSEQLQEDIMERAQAKIIEERLRQRMAHLEHDTIREKAKETYKVSDDYINGFHDGINMAINLIAEEETESTSTKWLIEYW